MPADAELSEVVALMAAAAQATGRPLDDPQLAADAAKLAAVALGSSLGSWLGLMRNRPAEGDDDNALRLQRYTVDQVVSVQAIQRDGAMSAKAQIVTRAMRDGEMRDEKPMTTEFLDDPIAKEVAGRAKALIGHPAVVYRHNEAAPKGYRAKHGDNAGEVVTQFRRIVWIDAADPPGARALAERDAGRSTRLAIPPMAPPPEERHPAPQAREPERGAPPAPAPEPERRPAPEAAPVAAEPAAQPALADAEPPPVVIDQRPVDPSFLAIVVAQLTAAETHDLEAPVRKEVLDAYRLEWWNKLGSERAAILRQVNAEAKAAGRPYLQRLHDPETTGGLQIVGNLTRDLLEREGAPA